MTKTTFMDIYPVNSIEIQKNQTNLKNIDEIISYYKNKIENHKIATYIATFDHYAHTTSINGDINPDIKDAKNIVFCFGGAIPNTRMLAVRPRTLGIAELEDSFLIEFMDAPKKEIQTLLEVWTKELVQA